MVKQIILIFFLITTSVSEVQAECRYEASGEVQGDKIINKIERVVCDEKKETTGKVNIVKFRKL